MGEWASRIRIRREGQVGGFRFFFGRRRQSGREFVGPVHSPMEVAAEMLRPEGAAFLRASKNRTKLPASLQDTNLSLAPWVPGYSQSFSMPSKSYVET